MGLNSPIMMKYLALSLTVFTDGVKMKMFAQVVHNAAGNFISPTERLSANAFQTILDIVLKVCSL